MKTAFAICLSVGALAAATLGLLSAAKTPQVINAVPAAPALPTPGLPVAAATNPFPINVGGAFELTDQKGKKRTQIDPQGNLQLVFFGYANCLQICSVALPLMADVVQAVAEEGVNVTPVMITIDPARDTVRNIGAPLTAYHPGFIGLTGSETELAPVYDLFSVERKFIFEDPEYGPIYAHGSHIYLMDAKGEFLTLLPPILSPERAAEIVTGYAIPS